MYKLTIISQLFACSYLTDLVDLEIIDKLSSVFVVGD